VIAIAGISISANKTGYARLIILISGKHCGGPYNNKHLPDLIGKYIFHKEFTIMVRKNAVGNLKTH
jgi:hypothetical protein